MKRKNEYADVIRDIYDLTPKAVFAAIAVSALTTGGDFLDEAKSRLLNEWRILHEQGIVPQAPPRIKCEPKEGTYCP